MKFSYRVVIALFVIVTAGVMLIYHNYPWKGILWKPTKSDDSGGKSYKYIYETVSKDNHYRAVSDQHLWWMKSQTLSVDQNEYNNKSYRAWKEVFGDGCKSAESAVVDLDTINILDDVDHDRPVPYVDTTKDVGRNLAKNKDGTNKQLRVIVVPHSHNDPGWTKTLDEYFQDQTKHTLNAMVDKLMKYPNMTFVWAEAVFLELWWRELDSSKRKSVRRLIDRRQLEIVVGSWVVPDEANPHYFALIDQMMRGHEWLERNLGVKPNNTWALDPFGYSTTVSYLYKLAGFSNMVILRVHETVKAHIQGIKGLDFWWRQYWDVRGEHDMKTHMMPYKLYNIKHTCGPDPFICLEFDFRNIPGEISEANAEPIQRGNVARQAKKLLMQYIKKSKLFQHNVVLIPLGDDFRFDRPIEWDQQYKNYMKLFNYMNSKPDLNVHARFGTVQDFMNEVEVSVTQSGSSLSKAFPKLAGDFFPYTDERNEYWTGYFSSRPHDKNLGREVERHLRSAEVFNALAVASVTEVGRKFVHYNSNMQLLRGASQSLSLFQHHDAITGTARSFVMADYKQRLLMAMQAAENVFTNSIEFLISKPKNTENLRLVLNDPANFKPISSAKIIQMGEKDKISSVVIVNSAAHTREEIVSIYVNSAAVRVYDGEQEKVACQVNPTWHVTDKKLDYVYELYFKVKLPALGISKYSIQYTNHGPCTLSSVKTYNDGKVDTEKYPHFNSFPSVSEAIVLENSNYMLKFSHRTGLLKHITVKSDNSLILKSCLSFLMYKSQGSGAYIFAPSGPATDTEFSTKPIIRVIVGPLVSEILAVNTYYNHTVRLYNINGTVQGNAIEINNGVDITSLKDREIIMRLETDISHNATFYTDANGLQMIKRKRFKNLPRSANYYPMTSMAYMQDKNVRFTILSTQPHGVSNQERDGNLEVMLDRVPLYDDNRGLGQGLAHSEKASSRFLLVLEKRSQSLGKRKCRTDIVSYPSLLSLKLNEFLQQQVIKLHVRTSFKNELSVFKPVTSSLPCDISLVHLRSRQMDLSLLPRADLVLFRQSYECCFGYDASHCSEGEDKFNIAQWLGGKTTAIIQTTLSGMHKLKDITKSESVHLKGMEMSTFLLTFRK